MWVKISEQSIISSDHIGRWYVEGREDNCRLMIETKTGGELIHSYHKSFRDAEWRLGSVLRAILEDEERHLQGRHYTSDDASH